MNSKLISILGSTGSIGTQTLSIAREYKNIQVKAITANSNIKLLEEQAREFKPELVAVADEEKAKDLKDDISNKIEEVSSEVNKKVKKDIGKTKENKKGSK